MSGIRRLRSAPLQCETDRSRSRWALRVTTRAMDIWTELASVLSALGVPAGAMALGYCLVRGAGLLERETSDNNLRYISALLKDPSFFSSSGKLGASIVPFIFDKTFGRKVFSRRFIIRSIMASILFWSILLIVRHDSIYTILMNSIGPNVGWWFPGQVALYNKILAL